MSLPLYPYQNIGAEFLRGKAHALLADDCGVGKSPQTVAACRDLKHVLVVCPAVAKLNWQREFIKFDDRHSFVVGGSKDQERSSVIITNYEQITNHLATYLKIQWDAVILDESHHCKSVDSKRAHAIFGIGGLIHSTKRVWCLSATPAPNNASELWVMFRAFGLTPMTYEGFIAKYCNTLSGFRTGGATRIQGTNTAMGPELNAILSRIMLRRKKEDVLKDLPSISFSTVAVESTYDPLKDFPEMKDKLKEEWEVLKTKINLQDMRVSDDNLLKTMSMMAQGTATLRRYHGLKKAAVCADIIGLELDAGAYDKIVIFAVHKDVVHMLAKLLKRHGVVKIVGGVSLRKKQEAQDRFQDPGSGIKVFIGNILSAGTNINLTAAHHVAFVEQDYVPGNNHQAAMRPHRPPQTKPVSVRAFGLAGFDERITRILTRKTEEIKTFID